MDLDMNILSVPKAEEISERADSHSLSNHMATCLTERIFSFLEENV